MVKANPLVVHDSGGNKPKSLGGTAANQILWVCQPLYWFTAPAKSLRKKFVWIVCVVDKGPGNGHPALLAAGKLGRVGFRLVGQAHLVK